MTPTRRHVLKTAAAASVLRFAPAMAQAGRPLKFNLLGFALGIHVPAMTAVYDIMPTMGYAPTMQRMDQIRLLTQTLIAGAADIGETDPITVMSAVEAGADLKIVGLVYNSTSLVFVVNADKVHDFKDLENPDNVVAVNGKGDITDVMLVGPLLKRGVDIDKVNIVEIGGSGARMQALLSGRVAAVPVHFDQAAAIAKRGNFKVLLQPWKEYKTWINEVWVVNGSWLKKKENERAVVDLLKAEMTAFRKSDDDLEWYTGEYRKHVTLKDAKDATVADVRPIWETLTKEIKAFPRDMVISPDDWHDLLPVYIKAGAIRGTVKVDQVVDPSFAKQAVAELGV
jgi:NitT/TauT family transport system substrate-binding protein